jgi:hypothetical protein
MHSGRWGVEEDDAWPPRGAPSRHNGRYVPDVNELDYTSAPRYHEVGPSALSMRRPFGQAIAAQH